MPATTRRRAFGLTVVLLFLLVSGCASHEATSTPASGGSTATRTPTPTPTATPMTAAELGWITAVTKLHTKIDKPFRASNITMTRAKMNELKNALHVCTRGLRRIGSPGNRLQTVYVTVQKACRTYDKGARCFATAAKVSDAAGATIAGTAEARTQERSLSCGFAAQGDGSNVLTDAEAKAEAIKAQFP
jgi:hypothetical protein